MTTFFLSKLLALFVCPLGGVILVGATALVLSFTKWRRIGQMLLGFALVCLWIPATPAFANWLNFRLESQYPTVNIRTLPQSDAVILLGDAADSRIKYALQIYTSDKASRIVISGGNPPWRGSAIPEAQRIADILVELGAPRSALILESASRTTRENAVNTAAIFKNHGWRGGFLVTSGVHMLRALAAFEATELSVIPAPTDLRAGSPHIDTPLDLLPDAGALAWSTLAIKEIIGLGFYRFRGWA